MLFHIISSYFRILDESSWGWGSPESPMRCFNARLCESLVELKSYVKKVSEEPWQYSWFVGLD